VSIMRLSRNIIVGVLPSSLSVRRNCINSGVYRHTVISHALSIIFSTCPPSNMLNHTLYFILLEVTSSYGLKPESEDLLAHVLHTTLAMMLLVDKSLPSEPISNLPESVIPSFILVNHLKALYTRLCNLDIVNGSTFTRILCYAIGKTPLALRPHLWTSKAVVCLARSLRATDYKCFVSLCIQLVQDVADLPPTDSLPDKKRDLSIEVHDRLAKWLEALCEHLITIRDVDPLVLQAITTLLSIAQPAGLHLRRDGLDTPQSQATSDALLCLAVLCLSFPHTSAISSYRTAAPTSILYEYCGANIDTFNPITSISLSHIAKDDSNDHVQMAVEVQSRFTALRDQATLLHSKRLFLLEAWFWSKVLSHIESLIPEINTRHDTSLYRTAFLDELERLQRETVKNIEDAERLHFANSSIAASIDQTPSKVASTARGSQFRWEELVGCWVLKTPLPVKTRRSQKRAASDMAGEDRTIDNLGEHVANLKRQRILETPLRPGTLSRAGSTSVPSEIPAQSSLELRISSSHMTPSTEEKEIVARETPVAGPTFANKKVGRRQSAFTSLLADARASRVVLHTKADDDDDVKDMTEQSSHARSNLEEWRTNRKPPKPSVTRSPRDSYDSYNSREPSSDDLNLFAYGSSEG
jgi:hypothetical protein